VFCVNEQVVTATRNKAAMILAPTIELYDCFHFSANSQHPSE
jgi:hypothetical protein